MVLKVYVCVCMHICMYITYMCTYICDTHASTHTRTRKPNLIWIVRECNNALAALPRSFGEIPSSNFPLLC